VIGVAACAVAACATDAAPPLFEPVESTPTGEGATILTADTTYLLEVRAAPGLEPTGLPVFHGA
jgi:hypothetical protein